MVQMNNVTMVYDNSDVAALDNFSLTINEGEFAFLVGPSGSGKIDDNQASHGRNYGIRGRGYCKRL